MNESEHLTQAQVSARHPMVSDSGMEKIRRRRAGTFIRLVMVWLGLCAVAGVARWLF